MKHIGGVMRVVFQILDWLNSNCRFEEYCFFGRKDLREAFLEGQEFFFVA